MKTALTLLAVAAVLVGITFACDSNAQSSNRRSVDTYTIYRNNSDAVVDGCEYFFSNENGTLSHKGNCRQCREFYKELFERKQ